MAGGEHARIIVCPTCLYGSGRIHPAERQREGEETDWYRCAHGHENGISWHGESLPEAPLWPATPRDRQVAEVVRAERAAGGGKDEIMQKLVAMGLL